MSEIATASDLPSLEEFYDRGLITDVLYRLPSGKEATVYCCQAGPADAAELLAAKVYRPVEQRSFKNDAAYRAGRVILDARSRRAAKKKTRHGRSFNFGSWIGQEYEILQQLHQAGADVPRPVAQSGNTILMEYVGDRDGPAPLLKSVSLEPKEARRLFDSLVDDVRLFLACNYIHADLSPYNVLYWRGELTIIDFPQAVDPRFNQQARPMLLRDLQNVCQYFSRYGVRVEPHRLTDSLWWRFMRGGQ